MLSSAYRGIIASMTVDPDDFEHLVRQIARLRLEVAQQGLALERLAALLDAGAQMLRALPEEEGAADLPVFDPANGPLPPQNPPSDRRRRRA